MCIVTLKSWFKCDKFNASHHSKAIFINLHAIDTCYLLIAFRKEFLIFFLTAIEKSVCSFKFDFCWCCCCCAEFCVQRMVKIRIIIGFHQIWQFFLMQLMFFDSCCYFQRVKHQIRTTNLFMFSSSNREKKRVKKTCLVSVGQRFNRSKVEKKVERKNNKTLFTSRLCCTWVCVWNDAAFLIRKVNVADVHICIRWDA